MQKVTVNGREFRLLFTTRLWGELAEEDLDVTDLQSAFSGKDRITKMVHLTFLLAREYCKVTKREIDFNEEWFAIHMVPILFKEYIEAALAAVTEGMKTDVAQEAERDLVLEEIQKKTEDTNSHTAG